jgi:hypothetical protein
VPENPKHLSQYTHPKNDIQEKLGSMPLCLHEQHSKTRSLWVSQPVRSQPVPIPYKQVADLCHLYRLPSTGVKSFVTTNYQMVPDGKYSQSCHPPLLPTLTRTKAPNTHVREPATCTPQLQGSEPVSQPAHCCV